MKYIVLIAVIGILLLQLTGAIPLSSVGGSMTIGLAVSRRRTGCRDPRGMDEETGCAWLDREHRCLARRRFSGRPPRRHGYCNNAQPVMGRASLAATGGPRDVCRARRHDGGHAAGIVGRAVDREPVAMSLFSGERAAATTAHLVRLVFSISDWTTAAWGTNSPSAGMSAFQRSLRQAPVAHLRLTPMERQQMARRFRHVGECPQKGVSAAVNIHLLPIRAHDLPVSFPWPWEAQCECAIPLRQLGHANYFPDAQDCK